MGEDHGVYFGSRQIGKVQVLRQGLYYRFICRCQLTGEVVYRLYVLCGDRKENLGVLIPMDDGFGLDTRIPAKRIGAGEMAFRLIPKHEQMQGKFVPIYPEEPFSYMEKLKDAFLTIQGSCMGILIDE